MANDLLNKKCVPCEGGIPPLTHEEIMNYMTKVDGWNLAEDDRENVKKLGVGARIFKEYKFKDFIGAINFVNHVAEIAEAEGHHPDIIVKDFNKVILEIWTHAIDGLHENDFILAAKIDASR